MTDRLGKWAVTIVRSSCLLSTVGRLEHPARTLCTLIYKRSSAPSRRSISQDAATGRGRGREKFSSLPQTDLIRRGYSARTRDTSLRDTSLLATAKTERRSRHISPWRQTPKNDRQTPPPRHPENHQILQLLYLLYSRALQSMPPEMKQSLLRTPRRPCNTPRLRPLSNTSARNQPGFSSPLRY